MIYIVEKYDDYYDYSRISSVHETEVDIEQEYSNFLNMKAQELGIINNPNYPKIMMDHPHHHPHLTKKEYNKKFIMWNKLLMKNDIVSFIEGLKIEKKPFQIIS